MNLAQLKFTYITLVSSEYYSVQSFSGSLLDGLNQQFYF